MMRSVSIREVTLVLAMLPFLSFGWGMGHDTVAQAVAARLPQPWCDRLQGESLQRFCADNHYPDSFEPFPVDRVGEEPLAYLNAQGVTKRFDLHSDRGRAVAFCMLVRALKEEQPDRALLWLAAFAHSTADMVACNHEPVVHIATYGWSEKSWAMTLPGGQLIGKMTPCLDLGWVETEAWARTAWGERLGRMVLRDSGASQEEALLEVMLYGIRGVDSCAPYGRAVVEASAGWTDTRDRVAGKRLAGVLSELGVWAVERCLRDFQAALRLAQAGVTPDVTDAVMVRYNGAVDEFMRARPLSADSFVRGAIEPPKGGQPYVGVITEPTWRMNESMFGPSDRVLAVQVVNTLRKQGMKAVLIDTREFLDGKVDLKPVSALVVPAQKCQTYRVMKADVFASRLAKYLADGGKVLWIGGSKPPKDLMTGLPLPVMVKANTDKDAKMPLLTGQLKTATLRLGSGPVRKLERPPLFQAGWHQPQNPFAFTPEAAAQARALAVLSGNGKEMTIGAAWPKESPAVAYLPIYAVFPYLWTQETPRLAPLRLELDSAGAEAVRVALEAIK